VIGHRVLVRVVDEEHFSVQLVIEAHLGVFLGHRGLRPKVTGRVGAEEGEEDHNEVDDYTKTVACRTSLRQEVTIVVFAVDCHTREN